jgi:hypothetical protein
MEHRELRPGSSCVASTSVPSALLLGGVVWLALPR